MRAELDETVIKDAKKLLKTTDAGILSTMLNHNEEVFPFGSMCPYVVTLEGDIVILISDIAVHTKNIKIDNKVSMTIFDTKAKNKQAASRISLAGKANKVEKDTPEYEMISERYLHFFPEAKTYFKMHDFNYYVIRPEFVHYVQTFGRIFSFDGAMMRDSMPEWYEGRHSVLEHMNTDHKDALVKYMNKLNNDGLKYEELKLVDLDQEGFHLSTGRGEFYYFNFENKALTANDLRKEFTALAKQ